MPKAGCRGLHYLAFPFTHYPIRHTHRGRTNTHRILLIWTHSGLNFHLAEMHGHTARFLHRSCEIVLYWLFWILRQRRIYKNIQDVTSFLLFKKRQSCWMSAAELSCAILNTFVIQELNLSQNERIGEPQLLLLMMIPCAIAAFPPTETN